MSPSAIPINLSSEPLTPMTESDIRDAITIFATATSRAIEAGFDGVDVHGANGYLVDQFTTSERMLGEEVSPTDLDFASKSLKLSLKPLKPSESDTE